MSSKQRSDRPKKRRFHGNRYTGSLVTPASELAEPQPQAKLPQSSSAQKLHVEQPDPATVGDEPLSGYRLFDIRPLVEFVQQFPCPTCQPSGYDATELGAGHATTVRFTCRACSAVMNLKTLVGKMKTAVMAIWKHRGKDHRDCGGRCPAHNGDVNRANRNSVLKAIKPVFETLSTDSLLSKCTHGGTQNSNESFHHLI